VISCDDARVISCDDARKFTEVNARTGRVDPPTVSPPDNAYLFETWHMVRRSGHWALASFTVDQPPSMQVELCMSLPGATA
jgi:hypothetical protein